jgi:GTP cyclohydrolase I
VADDTHSEAAAAIENFLRAIGAPVDTDPELRRTGVDVADAYRNELLEGYRMVPQEILAECTRSRARALVTLTNVAIHPVCPHHLLPSSGTAHVAYLPAGKVVGLGSLAKLIHCFARRLILQEDLAEQVVDALVTHLGASWAACTVDVLPMCIAARGAHADRSRALCTAFAGERSGDIGLKQEYFQTLSLSRSSRDA